MGVEMRGKARKSALNVVLSTRTLWATRTQSHRGPLRDNVELAPG